MPIPTSLVFLILGIIGLIIYFIQKKKQAKFSWIYLLLGILLILVGLVPGFFLSLQNDYSDSQVDCEDLSEIECTENQEVCLLCGESIISSYASCHSISFCNNVLSSTIDQFEFPDGISQRNYAIEQYLLTQKDFAWRTEEGSSNLCVFENLGSPDNLFPLFLWVYCQEYKIEDGNILELSGTSGPVLVDYPNELSFFDIERFSHQIPRDGSKYYEDIQNIFPKELQNEIFIYRGQNNLHEIWKERVVGQNVF